MKLSEYGIKVRRENTCCLGQLMGSGSKAMNTFIETRKQRLSAKQRCKYPARFRPPHLLPQTWLQHKILFLCKINASSGEFFNILVETNSSNNRALDVFFGRKKVRLVGRYLG
jgi:hypothetical protein